MTEESKRFLELLESRLALLDSLAAALLAARTDLVSLDISGLESRIVEQERLCSRIQALDLQLNRLQRQGASKIPLSSATPASLVAVEESARARYDQTLVRLAKAQAMVKKLNLEHQSLLRRSRRTVNALLNSYHSFALTYADPAEKRRVVGERA